MSKTELHKRFATALTDAHKAGMEAVAATTPTPMVVGTPRDLMGSLTGGGGGGFRSDRPTYFVSGGVCGFATVKLRAKSGEGRKLMNWLTGRVKTRYNVEKLLDACDLYGARFDSYYGGVTMGVGVGGQSLAYKEAYGRAFVEALREAEFEGLSVYLDSRMD